MTTTLLEVRPSFLTEQAFLTLGANGTFPDAFLPSTPQYGNYLEIVFHSPIPRYLANSLLVAVSVAAIQVICCSFFAYGVTFMRIRGRDMLFRLVLFTYMVPTAVTYIPCYIILSRLGF